MSDLSTLAARARELPVHVLIASLERGGAERAVVETVGFWQQHGIPGNLFVLGQARRPYVIPDCPGFRVLPKSSLRREQALIEVARQILGSPVHQVVTHLIPARELAVLWRHGVSTIPVIHNGRLGWQDEPSVFDHSMVPFLAADSAQVARELREGGCRKPVVVVRHEIQRWFDPAEIERDRARIRAHYGIGEHEFLVGMVGNFKAQKAYPRAIRVLAGLRQSVPARLIILGSWDHSYGYGERTFAATIALARELGLEAELLLPGGVEDVEAHYAAFDAFLNTSIHEGLSVAMLEARQSGCPVVTADAGGNIEALAPGSQTIFDGSNIEAYVEALLRVRRRRAPPLKPPAYPALIPQLWRQLGVFSSPRAGEHILFVTNNIATGGATRSLVRLLTHFPAKDRVSLCILGSVHDSACMDELEKAAVPVARFEHPANVVDCAERLLALVRELAASTLCFWNVHASVKLLTAKVLSAANTRIVDVSPGPMFFRELELAVAFQQRVAFTADDYFERLTTFVAKYRGGVPPAGYNVPLDKVVVIPNGVPFPAETEAASFPNQFPAAFRIVACCRLVPEKRVEFLVDSAAEVSRRLPQASLTVVGGPERSNTSYAESLARRAENRSFTNTWFVGRQPRVGPFLNSSRVFVTASMVDGCSNAVLEAMAAGLPVVAAATRAVTEQVEHGVTGFILSQDRTEEMADCISTLLTNPDLAHEFGQAGRRRAERSFGIDRMVASYASVLVSSQ
jgi:glycosyltransferase involved in cell wall biosynthesis